MDTRDSYGRREANRQCSHQQASGDYQNVDYGSYQSGVQQPDGYDSANPSNHSETMHGGGHGNLAPTTSTSDRIRSRGDAATQMYDYSGDGIISMYGSPSSETSTGQMQMQLQSYNYGSAWNGGGPSTAQRSRSFSNQGGYPGAASRASNHSAATPSGSSRQPQPLPGGLGTAAMSSQQQRPEYGRSAASSASASARSSGTVSSTSTSIDPISYPLPRSRTVSEHTRQSSLSSSSNGAGGRAFRPLPPAPPVTGHAAMLPAGAAFQSRPSQDSVHSGFSSHDSSHQHGYLPALGQTPHASGTIAPRPSLSSSYSASDSVSSAHSSQHGHRKIGWNLPHTVLEEQQYPAGYDATYGSDYVNSPSEYSPPLARASSSRQLQPNDLFEYKASAGAMASVRRPTISSQLSGSGSSTAQGVGVPLSQQSLGYQDARNADQNQSLSVQEDASGSSWLEDVRRRQTNQQAPQRVQQRSVSDAVLPRHHDAIPSSSQHLSQSTNASDRQQGDVRRVAQRQNTITPANYQAHPFVHSYSEPATTAQVQAGPSRSRSIAVPSTSAAESLRSRKVSAPSVGAINGSYGPPVPIPAPTTGPATANTSTAPSDRRTVSSQSGPGSSSSSAATFVGGATPSRGSTSSRQPKASQKVYSPMPSESPVISVSSSLPDTSFSSIQSHASMQSVAATSNQSTSNPPVPTKSKSLLYKQQQMLSPAMTMGSYFGSQAGLSSAGRRESPDAQRRRFAAKGLYRFDPALLSNIATAAKDRVRRSTNSKAGIQYDDTFTGEDLVATVAELLPTPYAENVRVSLSICRLLQQPTFLYEVDGDDVVLQDSPDQVFAFAGEAEESTYDYLVSSSDYRRPGSMRFPSSTAIPEPPEVPKAVLTRFTKCYSPFCGQEGTPSVYQCYSLYCPNGNNPLGLQRKESSVSLAPSTEDAPAAQNWTSTVTPELLASIDKREAKRQNVIFEFIKIQTDSKADIDLWDTAYRQPLLKADPPVLHPAKLDDFITHTFGNLTEVRSMLDTILNFFLTRQREQSPVIERFGDVVLDCAIAWGPTYLEFAKTQAIGDYLITEEKAGNPSFAAFLESRRQAFGIKQDWRHYHSRAQLMLPRLPNMLIPELLKHTPEEHPDYADLQRAKELIAEQCQAINSILAGEALKVACSRYNRLIERDQNWNSDLDLGHPTRSLFHHGRMLAKPEGPTSDWSEHQVMLFDNFLLITKPRRIATATAVRETYRLRVRPIRLELLDVSGFDDPPSVRTTSTLHGVRSIISTSDRRDAASHNVVQKEVFPIIFKFGGRESGTLTLYVEGIRDRTKSADFARREWQDKLTEAIGVRQAICDANKAFRMNLLVDPTSRNHAASANPIGRIHCSYPFWQPKLRNLVAVGTSTGLWFSQQYDVNSLRQVLRTPATACAVLQEFGIVLIQAEGRLLAYLLDTLIQSSDPDAVDSKGPQGPQRVSGNREINFFKVGRVGERTLAVYAKREGVNGTVLKAMEPIAGIERSRAQNSRFLGMGSKRSDWFRLYKDGGVPTEVSSLSFTRSKLALVCAPGFEILDVETLKTGSFPDWAALKNNSQKYDGRMAQLQRRCQSARAVSLFRISDQEYLFCYDSFAFFADKHGDPIPERFGDIIEWEGRASAVVFYRPFILVIDPQFVEIRDLSRGGTMVQLIKGNDIRCSYDGQGIGMSDVDVRPHGTMQADERKPHIIIREGKEDKIYELAPCWV